MRGCFSLQGVFGVVVLHNVPLTLVIIYKYCTTYISKKSFSHFNKKRQDDFILTIPWMVDVIICSEFQNWKKKMISFSIIASNMKISLIIKRVTQIIITFQQ